MLVCFQISKHARAPVSFQPISPGSGRFEDVLAVMENCQQEGGQLYGQISPGDATGHVRLG